MDAEQAGKIRKELRRSTDLHAVLFNRAVILTEVDTALGARPVWCLECLANGNEGGRTQREDTAGGHSGRTQREDARTTRATSGAGRMATSACAGGVQPAAC